MIPLPDNPEFWSFAAMAVSGLIVAARAIQKLSDHIKRCDERYEDLKDRFVRVEKGVARIEDVLIHEPGH